MTQKRVISERFHALEAWRGICALAVALFHLPAVHLLTGSRGLLNLQFSVDFFFVLSGFVISYSYRDRITTWKDAARFMMIRFGRLWPLHTSILALMVCLELIKLRAATANPALSSLLQEPPFAPGHSAMEILTSALFLQAFGIHSTPSWNFPAWSVGAEFYTYIVFAIASLCLPRRNYVIMTGLALLAAGVLYLVSPSSLFVSFKWGFLRCLFGFGAGCLLFRLREIRRRPLPVPTALELGAMGLVVLYISVCPPGPAQYAAPLTFAPLVYVFSFDSGAASRILQAKLFQALGSWSYSIYMIHVLVLHFVRSAAIYVSHAWNVGTIGVASGQNVLLLGSSPEAPFLACIATIVLIVPFAALTYRWIERPCTNFFRDLAKGSALKQAGAALTLCDRSMEAHAAAGAGLSDKHS
jgi:peptidoglycan/LPS O-acetylase OafA/YrhL